MYTGLVLAQLGSCLAMAGLILIVQFVHYPAFSFVEEAQFKKFAIFHGVRISFIVIPLMITELASGFALFYFFSSWVWTFNLALIGLIWLSTALLSVPCHAKLEKSKDIQIIRRLVETNWPRTVLWVGRSLFFLVYLYRAGVHIPIL